MSDVHVPRTHGKLFAENAAKQGIKLVAPDGAWGWVIVAAFAISHFCAVPVFSVFGMIFTDKFKRLGITATDISIILNINSAVGFGFGLMNGPLLRIFSYRQLSIFGSILLFLGTMLIAFANTMPFFIMSFGVTFALGFSLLSQPQTYAINLYFLRLRGRAVSVAVGVCGFGAVLVPLIVGKLVEWYGPEDTMLFMAALVLHCLPASLLLQPVRWHMIKPPQEPQTFPSVDTTKVQTSTIDTTCIDSNNKSCVSRRRTITVTSVDVECHSLYTPDNPIVAPMERRLSSYCESPTLLHRSSSTQQIPLAEFKTNYHWWSSDDTVYLGSSAQIFEDIRLNDSSPPPTTPLSPHPLTEMHTNNKTTIWICIKLRALSYAKSIVKFFDLSLFCDSTFVSLCLGISMAMFADINFSLLFSFILRELHGQDINEISHVISAMSACDILLRFTSPYIGEAVHLSYKTMYVISIVLLVVVRTIFLFVSDYKSLIIIGCGLGVAKGMRSVFMPLVIPSYIPLDRLAAATGLQMVCNGILFLTVGPVLGWIRDISGSYFAVVITMNMISLFTVILWTSQLIIAKCKSYKHTPVQSNA